MRGMRANQKMTNIPYSRCEALPQGRTLPAACCRELPFVTFNEIVKINFLPVKDHIFSIDSKFSKQCVFNLSVFSCSAI